MYCKIGEKGGKEGGKLSCFTSLLSYYCFRERNVSKRLLVFRHVPTRRKKADFCEQEKPFQQQLTTTTLRKYGLFCTHAFLLPLLNKLTVIQPFPFCPPALPSLSSCPVQQQPYPSLLRLRRRRRRRRRSLEICPSVPAIALLSLPSSPSPTPVFSPFFFPHAKYP